MKKQILRPFILLSLLFTLFWALSFLCAPYGKTVKGVLGVVNIPEAEFSNSLAKISPDNWELDEGMSTDGSLTYKLTSNLQGTGFSGFLIKGSEFGPDVFINGAGERAADDANRALYSSRGYAAYFFQSGESTEILLKYSNGFKGLPPYSFIGSQGAVLRALGVVYGYYALCAGFCLLSAILGFAWYTFSRGRKVHLFAGLFSLSAALLFIFANNGACSYLLPFLSAKATVKIFGCLTTATAVLYAQLSARLFKDALNKWVVLGFSIYGAVCAAVMVAAPLSAQNPVFNIFLICSAGFCGYVFVALLYGIRNGNVSWPLWVFNAVLFTALALLYLTSFDGYSNPLDAALMTLIFSVVICQKSAHSITASQWFAPQPSGGALSEAGRIVGSLSNLKSELFSNLPSELKALAGNERDYAPHPPRRAVGLSEEDELIRDLKQITAESNRLGVLAARVAHALTATEPPLLQKVQLTKCAEKSYELYAPMFADNNNAVTLETDSWLPFVNGDENLIMQSILNMLTNANDRTENGEVNISVSRGGDKQSVEFITHDNGDVIPADMINLLFSNDDSAASEPRLADLYLVRNIAENFGGSLRVESTLRDGTTLSLLLPAYREPDEDNLL